MPAPIVILGMHRSGTSLTTALVHLMGAYAGAPESLLPAAKDNPKGYFERKDAMDCNIALLKQQGIDWPGYFPTAWPIPCDSGPIPPGPEKQMRLVLADLSAHTPSVMKDPRLCLTLPYWQTLMGDPVCIIVYRDPVEIALSLQKRGAPFTHLERGIALWEFYAASLLTASADLPRAYVAHAELLADPVGAMTQLYEALQRHGVQGLRLPTSIGSFIDPALYRSKSQGEAPELTSHQQHIMAMMRGEFAARGTVAVSEESLAILRNKELDTI